MPLRKLVGEASHLCLLICPHMPLMKLYAWKEVLFFHGVCAGRQPTRDGREEEPALSSAPFPCLPGVSMPSLQKAYRPKTMRPSTAQEKAGE